MTIIFGIGENEAGAASKGQVIDHDTERSTKRAKDLALYKNFSAATEAMVAIIKDRHTHCPRKHTMYVNLSKYRESDKGIAIETIVTVCEQHKAQGWRSVYWIEAQQGVRSQRSAERKICDTLKNPKLTRRLCIQMDSDGSWKEVSYGRIDLSLNSQAQKPGHTLADSLQVVNCEPELMSLTGALRDKKWDRLDLAARIVRSVLCLIGSPLVCHRWRPQDLLVSHTNPVSDSKFKEVQVYLESDSHSSEGHVSLVEDPEDRFENYPPQSSGSANAVSKTYGTFSFLLIYIVYIWVKFKTFLYLRGPLFFQQDLILDRKVESVPQLSQDDPITAAIVQDHAHVDNLHKPTVKHRVVLDIALLLFQLLFLKEVEIIEGDEERGINDNLEYEGSMQNALIREFEAFPKENFIQEQYLKVIDQCLEEYTNLGNMEDVDFRYGIYDTVFTPLEALIAAHSPSGERWTDAHSSETGKYPLQPRLEVLGSSNQNIHRENLGLIEATDLRVLVSDTPAPYRKDTNTFNLTYVYLKLDKPCKVNNPKTEALLRSTQVPCLCLIQPQVVREVPFLTGIFRMNLPLSTRQHSLSALSLILTVRNALTVGWPTYTNGL
jgi:hypothetical protein